MKTQFIFAIMAALFIFSCTDDENWLPDPPRENVTLSYKDSVIPFYKTIEGTEAGGIITENDGLYRDKIYKNIFYHQIIKDTKLTFVADTDSLMIEGFLTIRERPKGNAEIIKAISPQLFPYKFEDDILKIKLPDSIKVSNDEFFSGWIVYGYGTPEKITVRMDYRILYSDFKATTPGGEIPANSFQYDVQYPLSQETYEQPNWSEFFFSTQNWFSLNEFRELDDLGESNYGAWYIYEYIFDLDTK